MKLTSKHIFRLTFILSSIFLIAGCKLDSPGNLNVLKGEGPIVNKVVPLDSIESIAHIGVGNMYITHGDTQKVTISAQQNILDHILYSVDSHIFSWGFDQNYTIDPTSDSITVELVLTRNISAIELDGYGNIIVGSIPQNSIRLIINGAGSILGYGIPVNNCEVSILGNGNCQVDVSDTLTGIISGSGNIYYKGHPFINLPVIGVGSVLNSN